MEESIGSSSDAHQAVADDFDFAVLEEYAKQLSLQEENVFTLTDEEYAKQLSLQEALKSTISLSDIYKNTESNSGGTNDKKMKSPTDVNASVGDEQYYSSDEKHVEELSLQEALMSFPSVSNTNSSSHPHYQKSGIGESSTSTPKIEHTHMKTESNSGNSIDRKMELPMDVNATVGDDHYSSDEKYAAELSLQEALKSFESFKKLKLPMDLLNANAGDDHYSSDEKYAEELSLQEALKSFESFKNMKSPMDINASIGDDHYSSDEKYAEELSLQEALKSFESLKKLKTPADVNASVGDEQYYSSDEKYAQQLSLQEALMSFASLSDTNNDKKMKSSMDVNASVRDYQYYSSEISLCQICIEAKPAYEMRNSTNSCTHVYCSECIAKHVAAKIQENITQIKCPEFNCKENLEPHLCRDMIPWEVLDRWENALCESSILASHKVYCPFKDCSALLVHDDDEWMIIRETECPHCRRLFCAKCKVPWHSNMDCSEYQELIKKGGAIEDVSLLKLAEQKKWKRCPKCNFYVEKTVGCVHITCRCKHEFCYICGLEWRQRSHVICQREV